MTSRKQRKRWTVAGLMLSVGVYCLFDARPLYALFGIGDIVFDPSSYATLGEIWTEDISNGIKIEESIQQAIKIYNNGVQIYNLAQYMAQRIEHKGAWLTAGFPLGNETILHHYNEAINFQDAMNGDVANAGIAYQMSTLDGGNAGYLGGSMAAQSRRMAEYASIQLVDQASRRCAAVLANYNATQQMNTPALAALGNDIADESDGANSEMAGLNILGGAAQQQQTQTMANGNLQACLAEQEILTNKMRRDDLSAAQGIYNDRANEVVVAPTLLDPNDTALYVAGGYLVP